MRTRITLLTVATAALASGACGREEMTSPPPADDAEEMPLETFAAGEAVPAALAEVVATVEAGHGGEVTFLDMGDGHIGVAERAPLKARFVSAALIRNSGATPLEVYLALSPQGAAVPDALSRDHLRIARSRKAATSPRILAQPTPGTAALTYGIDEYYGCQSPGTEWIAGWKADFAGVTKYREAAYFTENSFGVTFYPGAPVYYGTNTNSVTYLGTCNGDAIFDLWVEVHRRINGAWVVVHTTSVLHDGKYTFYSGLPASYRGVVKPLFDPWPIEDFGIGAAWTLSPPLVSP